jgi:hypothetical protein
MLIIQYNPGLADEIDSFMVQSITDNKLNTKRIVNKDTPMQIFGKMNLQHSIILNNKKYYTMKKAINNANIYSYSIYLSCSKQQYTTPHTITNQQLI